MTNEELMLDILKEIKTDIKEMKENYVTKEVCNLKCETSNKKTTIISTTIASVVAICAMVVKYLFSGK